MHSHSMTLRGNKLGNTIYSLVHTQESTQDILMTGCECVYKIVLSRRRQISNPHKCNVEQHAIISYFWYGVSVNTICTQRP